MTDNELLLALSEMMDRKLDARLKPIESNLQDVRNEVKNIRNEVKDIRNDVKDIKNDVQDVRNEIKDIRNEVQDVRNEIKNVKNEVHSFNLFQENAILPRLETIESCYTDTYQRYKNYADRMESAFADIDLLKKVVREHSAKLEKVS